MRHSGDGYGDFDEPDLFQGLEYEAGQFEGPEHPRNISTTPAPHQNTDNYRSEERKQHQQPSELKTPDTSTHVYDGYDSTRQIRVAIDKQWRFHAVEISDSWRHSLPPGDLARAIQNAAEDAMLTGLRADPPTLKTRSPHGQDQGNEAETGNEPANTLFSCLQPGPANARPDFGDIVRLLHQAERQLDEYAQSLEKSTVQQSTETSPNGNVRVVMNQGNVTDINIDAASLARAPIPDIEYETLSALQGAQSSSVELTDSLQNPQGPLQELEFFAANPEMLLRRIGITAS